MKSKIFYLLGIVAVVAIVFFTHYVIPRPTINEPINEVKPKTPDLEAPELEFELPLSNSNDPKEVAWNLFQKYLNFNKAKNKEGVKSVVYKIAAVCEDPKTTIDCEGRMGAAYEYGITLKKEKFVHIWEDEAQLVLSTDFWVEENDQALGRFRSIIFFVKDGEGTLKLLSFSPTKGGATTKGEASKQELDARILRWTEDNDQDGIADYNEECLSVSEGQVCNKTNPKLRDTDGDGLWDGVEALMN